MKWLFFKDEVLMEDFNLPSSKDIDKFWIGVPGRVNIILQETTI